MKQVLLIFLSKSGGDFWFPPAPRSDRPETEEEVLRAVRGTEFLRLHLSDDKQFTELIQIIENFS